MRRSTPLAFHDKPAIFDFESQVGFSESRELKDSGNVRRGTIFGHVLAQVDSWHEHLITVSMSCDLALILWGALNSFGPSSVRA